MFNYHVEYDFFTTFLPIILLSFICIISYSTGRIHERYMYKAYLKEVLQKCESCGTLNEAVQLMENTTDERYTDWRRKGSYLS